MLPIIIVIVVIVAGVAAFMLLRKPVTPQLPETEPEPAKLPKPKTRPKAAAKPEPAKAAAPAKAKEAPAPVAQEPDEEEPDEEEFDEEPEDEEEEQQEQLAEEDAAEGDEALEELPAETVAPAVAKPPPAPISRRKKDVKGLRKKLSKVRQEGGFFGRLKALFSGKKEIDPSIVEEMEEILLTSDVGVTTTEALLADIKERLDKNELADGDAVWSALRERASELLELPGGGAIRNHGTPTVVLMVGVNGTGKTTTIGKLATKFVAEDKRVLLVAGDTFRAAAVAQLKVWGKRVGCEVFAKKDGTDPASVVFDAVKHGADGAFDIILVDTAGRLHTKSNLMDELVKVVKTANKALPGAPHETLLVVDGTTGQNALQQAEMFNEAMDLNGIVLTKLDGTAKGGVVLAIASEYQLPVRYIGVGERPQDLRDFDADEFVEAMLGSGDDAAQAA